MAKKRYIQLPKEYISYSQIQLWKSDKERYKQWRMSFTFWGEEKI